MLETLGPARRRVDGWASSLRFAGLYVAGALPARRTMPIRLFITARPQADRVDPDGGAPEERKVIARGGPEARSADPLGEGRRAAGASRPQSTRQRPTVRRHSPGRTVVGGGVVWSVRRRRWRPRAPADLALDQTSRCGSVGALRGPT